MDNRINMSITTTPEKSKRKEALPQIIAVMVKNLLLLSYGLTLGYPTILISGVTDKAEKFQIDEEVISWLGSINLICIPIGCIISGTLSEQLGRKVAMMLINVPFMAAWLLFYFSYKTWHIFLALAITGLTGGSLEAPVLTYIAEITQPQFRGILASISSSMSTFGISVMFIFGMFLDWRTIALISCGFHAVSLISLFFIPETPFWLIKKGRLEAGKKSLAWLRGWTTIEAIEAEYEDIYTDVRIDEDIKKRDLCTRLKFYMKKSFLWPFALITFMHFLSHYGGTSPLQAYAVMIFDTLRTPISDLYATGILGLAEITGCVANSIMIYWWGKRALTFISLIGMGVIYIVVGTYAHTWEIETLLIPNLNISELSGPIEVPEDNRWAPLFLLVTYMFFAFIGIRVIPWVIVVEIFNSDTRATGAGICSAITYIFSFISNKTYFRTVSDLTLAGSFWLYASISLAGCAILYYTLPETEGKSLFEISEHFDGGKKLDNRIYRTPKKNVDVSVNWNGATNAGFVGDANEDLEGNQMTEIRTLPKNRVIVRNQEVTKL